MADKPEAKKAAAVTTETATLPRAVIMERDQPDSERVDGATYVDRDTFDRIARAGGYGSADALPTDASLDLSGLKGKRKEEVEEIFAKGGKE